MHLQKLLEKGYIAPLKEKFPETDLKICPGQVNTLYERVVSALLQEGWDVSLVNPAWFESKPKLVVLGAGHVGKEIAAMGKFLDFEVTVIDDREEFVTKNNLKEADYVYCHEFDTVEQILPTEKNVFLCGGNPRTCGRQNLCGKDIKKRLYLSWHDRKPQKD